MKTYTSEHIYNIPLIKDIITDYRLEMERMNYTIVKYIHPAYYRAVCFKVVNVNPKHKRKLKIWRNNLTYLKNVELYNGERDTFVRDIHSENCEKYLKNNALYYIFGRIKISKWGDIKYVKKIRMCRLDLYEKIRKKRIQLNTSY